MMKHCIIIGRRFPICQIKMLESTIEVSSFGTNDTYMKKSEEVDCLEGANGYNDGGILRWNSMKRDFTINSLFFNPMNYRIYDYVNGVSDMRKKKVRTVVPAHVSFKEDPARILRGLRIAGRLGFQFSSETSKAIRDLSSSIMTIPKGRLMVEMNYMLSYGAAESTFRLLRKYGLLDILLPFQAAYLSDQMKGRSSDRDLMLMKLFANLDKLLSADRPCHRSLWLALLAFHSALINSPQDAQVVKAFAALLHLGSWERTINFLEQDVGARAPFVPETLRPSGTKLDNLMEQTSHLASLVESSVQTLTCLDALQQSVARHWEPSQFSGVVFVSKTEGGRLLRIFEGLSSDLTSYDHGRGMHGIDYRLLKDWNPSEIRFVLGKVILDTMNDRLPCASTEDAGITRTTPANLADGIRPRLSTLFQS
uniref:Poly A polymerase head domain-containing protein n=1 Tax=Arundo donax TaxID=35708 RepID=A0A0A9D6Z9_ARUDO